MSMMLPLCTSTIPSTTTMTTIEMVSRVRRNACGDPNTRDGDPDRNGEQHRVKDNLSRDAVEDGDAEALEELGREESRTGQ